MAKDLLGYSVQGFRVSVPTGSALEIPGAEGQLKMILKPVSGSSLEIGGPSLAAGSGWLMQFGVNAIATEYFGSGPVYAIATGATAILSVLRVIRAGNPGSLG